MTEWLDRAVAAGDLDELVRGVDRLCAAADWEAVQTLRLRARAAIERGFQLWPAAAFAEYRLALEAPPEIAAAVVAESSGAFAVGPLTEVVASNHTWEELEPHLPSGPERGTVADERVVRGEDLTEAPGATSTTGLPLRLQEWEPDYAVPVYRSDSVDAPEPDVPDPAGERISAPPGQPVDDDQTLTAMADVVRLWTTQSGGSIHLAAVEGGVIDAIGLLSTTAVRTVALTPAQSVAWLAALGAGGGTHGRRRGAAQGRFNAWWAAAALAGLDWPPEPDELGAAVNELVWIRWDTGPRPGHDFRLAVADPLDGLAWAIDAHDPPPGPAGKI